MTTSKVQPGAPLKKSDPTDIIVARGRFHVEVRDQHPALPFLSAELGITGAQKSVWDAYAETIKGNLRSRQGMWRIMKTVFEAKTPADRLDAQIAAMESRLAALKEVKPALEKLYAALSDEQKKKADEVLTGLGCMM
jgi:hypothetical protein